MAQNHNNYFSKGAYSKEPHIDAVAVWSGAEPDNPGDGMVTVGERTTGEYWLWKSVIAQALQDAASVSKDRKMKSVRAEAIAWFSLQNEHFLFVCELAGLCPKSVLERSRYVIADAKRDYGRLKQHMKTKKRWKWLGQHKERLHVEEEASYRQRITSVAE